MYIQSAFYSVIRHIAMPNNNAYGNCVQLELVLLTVEKLNFV